MGPVTGDPIVGQTLTAGAVTPSGATVNYQWLYCDPGDTPEDNDNYKEFVGQTNLTYEIAADEGLYIKVRATGTGNYTGTVYSGAVGPVVPN